MPKLSDFNPSHELFLPTAEECIKIYELLYLTSALGKELSLQKDKLVPKIFTGIGQEAIGVGAVLASEKCDWFSSDHRAMGVLLGRGITPKEIICQDGAFKESLYGGADFGIHIGDPERHVVRFISDMAANVAVGTGLIDGVYYFRDIIEKKSQDENPVLLAFLGDGALSHGNAHSAFLFASARKLPVLFIINNNGLAIRTPTGYQSALRQLSKRAEGYGMKHNVVDGNDVLDVWSEVKHALSDIRNGGGPWVLECRTFRGSGHNELETPEMADYVPRMQRAIWKGKNPLERYRLQLKISKIWDEKNEPKFKEAEARADAEIKEAFDSIPTFSAPGKLHEVFAQSPKLSYAHKESVREISYEAAINEALLQAMEEDKRIRVFGEDVGSGGVHGVTKKLQKIFGEERVFHTPLDENGIFAYAIGLALAGLVPCPEAQFLPFMKYAAAILEHYAATNFYVTGKALSMVIRAPYGGGFNSNECHQKMDEVSYAHAGGLKIVFPADPFDAKGMLLSAFKDGNVIIFGEQISHYGHRGIVPEEPYYVPLDTAKVKLEGDDISLITYGAMMLDRTLRAAGVLADCGISAEVIDLRSIVPLDMETVMKSVEKTSAAVVVHEAKKEFGIGAEITAEIHERIPDHLWCPVKRIGAKPGPATAHPALEALRLPSVDDIVLAAKEALK